MEIIERSHRFAKEIIQENEALRVLYAELKKTIVNISDDELIATFENQGLVGSDSDSEPKNWMSLSHAINQLLDDKLTKLKWDRQSPIFQGEEYKSIWTLDFSKEVKVEVQTGDDEKTKTKNIGVAVEVAFNHGEAIAWNLMKPVLAAEVNHLDKKLNVDAGIGIMIVATDAMKKAGAFDSAVGSYERVEKYLVPMQNQLTVPIMLIGLQPPKTFKVSKQLDAVTRKNKGVIERLD